MLLLLTIQRHAFSLQIVWISCNACAAVSTQMTRPPRLVKTDSKSSSCLSSVSMARHLIFFARSRARFKSANCCFPCGTTALYRPILKLIFLRWSRSSALIVLRAIKLAAVSVIVFCNVLKGVIEIHPVFPYNGFLQKDISRDPQLLPKCAARTAQGSTRLVIHDFTDFVPVDLDGIEMAADRLFPRDLSIVPGLFDPAFDDTIGILISVSAHLSFDR